MKKICHILFASLVFMTFMMLGSCKNDEPSELNLEKKLQSISLYLKSNPNYSILVEALDKIDLMETLNVYGTNTLFAPTNTAFQKYFSDKGINSVSQIDAENLRKLLFYHLYSNTYTSNQFITGSFPEPTLAGNYIKIDITKGIKNAELNNYVKVDTLDVSVTNGVIHVVDRVLEPPAKSMYESLKSNGKYSIMLEAFEKTDNLKMISDISYEDEGKTKVLLRTIFLETDEVLLKEGIASFDDLAKRFSDTYYTSKDYTNPIDSLNIFVRYHCMDRKYFLSDVKNDYYLSCSENLFLIFSTMPEITINKRDDIYVGVNVLNSNNVNVNGITHTIDHVLSVYEPKAIQVALLFAGAPEDRVFTYDGESYNITDRNIMTQFLGNDEAQESVWWLKWEGFMSDLCITAEWPANAFADYCCYVVSNTGQYSLELTTKMIFKGKYRVYVSYRRGTNTNYMANFYWDGEPLKTPDGKESLNIDLTRSPDQFGETINSGTDVKIYRGLGVVDLTKMAQHKFKLTLPNPGASYTVWYSLELRPID